MDVCTDQRRIPGISRLFADYLYEPAKLAAFFGPAVPHAPDSWDPGPRLQGYPAARRAAVGTILEEQNRELGAGAETLSNLGRLRRPEAVAVVAGQQAGLFGGPLLALHKAMSAVLLAERLQQRGVDAVPVFWIASQDHDLEEVNHAWVLDAAATPVRIAVPGNDGAPGRPAGRVRFGPEIVAALDAWQSVAGRPAEAGELLRRSYRPGASFAQAFGELLLQWFAPWGLVVIDPLHAGLQALARPLYDRVLAQQAALEAALAARATALQDAGYHVQVRHQPGSTLLFLEHQGVRTSLRRQDDGYRLDEVAMSGDALRRQITAAPDTLSASALLRPVVQDFLLPTVAQVAGPAETAYLAQSAGLYPVLAVERPVTFPRLSATLVDARARRILDKYDLQLDDLWHEPGEAVIARRAVPPEIEQRAAGVKATIQREFAELGQLIQQLDPTLSDPVAGTAEKLRAQIEQLEARVARSITRRQDEVQRQAQHVLGTLVPQRGLQERTLNSADWVTRTDGKLLPLLHDTLRLDCMDHQVVAV